MVLVLLSVAMLLVVSAGEENSAVQRILNMAHNLVLGNSVRIPSTPIPPIFEEKSWKLPGIDMTDYFNFGLHEKRWKDYWKQLEHLMETAMQSKICVYESGRAEQDYDPDLPPELVAAAGLHSVSTEPANVGKVDGGQIDLVNGFTRQRPPLPMWRPIQVETGHGERFPSIDTRPTRMRDSDAIIEIASQGSANDDSLLADDVADLPKNDNLREDLSEGCQRLNMNEKSHKTLNVLLMSAGVGRGNWCQKVNHVQILFLMIKVGHQQSLHSNILGKKK